MDSQREAWDTVRMPDAKDFSQKHCDVTILGGGPVGLLSALALADRLPSGLGIRLIAGRRAPAEDGRAAALFGRSMAILDALGLGEAFHAEGAPLAGIRIIDATGRLLRAPTTLFRAAEAGLESFGVSLLTARIAAILRDRVEASPRITLAPVDAVAVERVERGWRIVDDGGAAVTTSFLVAADGQRSLARDAAGIETDRWRYPQTAHTFAVRHALDHEDVSTEFHTAEGPFTLVPAGDRMSTVVWMTSPATAERLASLDDDAFALAAERTCGSILGRLTLASARGAYPMAGMLAKRFAAPGVALVGETGHAFPPIGAQGMNLGFRDADTLADALAEGIEGPGAATRLDRWDHDRRRDAGLRTRGVDLLNRSLLTDLLPVQAARGLGLAALAGAAPLRRAAMRIGLAE
jgi:2-octaprenyl-6-methoxyphenol hydroxylase